MTETILDFGFWIDNLKSQIQNQKLLPLLHLPDSPQVPVAPEFRRKPDAHHPMAFPLTSQ